MGVRFAIRWLSFALLFGGFVAWLPSANAAEAMPGEPALGLGQPATWMSHDIIVKLNDLSKRYSCNDLWYKFHDVLLEIGARSDMKILPYRCEPALGAAARSPSVQLHFMLPEVLHGKLARWAEFRVVNSTVTLEPGHPISFDASDCDLLRQVKDTLLTRVVQRDAGYHLACHAPANYAPGYSLSVVVLKPVNGSETRIARRAYPSNDAAARSSGRD